MKRVLIIDEEVSCHALYEEELKPQGYEVMATSDWTMAMKWARQSRPACVIIDLSLLNLYGVGFLRSLLSQDSSIPIILTSSCHDERDDFASWSAPAFVVKTSDLNALKETLDRATNGTRVAAA